MRPVAIVLLAIANIALIVLPLFLLRPQLIVDVEPVTARITFAEQSAVGQGTFKVTPGTYDLNIEQEGYIPLKRPERLGFGQRTRLEITLKPIPQNAAVTTSPVTLVDLSSDKSSVLYIGNGGRTLYARMGEEEKALTPDVLGEPSFFGMSPAQDVALLRKANGDVYIYDFKRYNLVEQVQLFFGREIVDIDWVYPTGDKLLYSYLPAGGERSLIVADRTNKDLERVLNLAEAEVADPLISVAPDGKNAILVSRPGTDFPNHNLFLFDLFAKRVRKLSTDGSKIAARFSPAGDRILFTRFEEDPDQLMNQLVSAMDVDGKNRKDFELRATLEQIAFLDDHQVVVAATKKVGDTAVLAPQLFRIDLASGEVKQYYHEPLAGLHVGKIVVAADGQSVYVTAGPQVQAQSGTLYLIKLATDEYKE